PFRTRRYHYVVSLKVTEQAPMKRYERFKDQHLPLAHFLAENETGQYCSRPPRAIRKRAAEMLGRGSDFTPDEIEVASEIVSGLSGRSPLLYGPEIVPPVRISSAFSMPRFPHKVHAH